jgi:hypothetical protein
MISTYGSMALHMISHEKDHLRVKKREPKYPRRKLKKNGEPYVNYKFIPCPVCHKMFTKHKLRTDHQYVHFAEKAFKCPICLKGPKNPISVKKHIYVIHPQNYESPDIYICTSCTDNDVRFDSWNELGAHMEEIHLKEKSQVTKTNDGDVKMTEATFDLSNDDFSSFHG